MIFYLLIGVALLVAFWFLARAFVAADPKNLARMVTWVGAGSMAVLALYLLFKGQLGAMSMAASAILPFFVRWRRLWQMAKNARGPTPGQTTALETKYLKVELDHDSGRMTGDILAGRHRGRRLEHLDVGDLVDLLAEARVEDPDAVQVLETFLEREHGEAWRSASSGRRSDAAGSPVGGPMTKDEAFKILGLESGASEEAIREAHRRLMLANHPDRGGSTYIAAQINRAKDLLLDGR
jgi:hypothetical protein